MATARFSTKSPTIRRIMKEAQELSSNPSPDYTAAPLESDLFEWHFTFRGPPKSVYSDGIYHGRIVLPPSYPLRPPSFRFVTPSGRFEANREICLSISGHHEETWQPAWGVRTALVALRSFMETDPRGQLGGLDTTDAVRKRMAAESHAFRCPACNKTNQEIIGECEAAAAEAAPEKRTKAEVEIPPELKMGWKDEMTPSTRAAGASHARGDSDSAQSPAAVEHSGPASHGGTSTIAGGPAIAHRVSPSEVVHGASGPRGQGGSQVSPPPAHLAPLQQRQPRQAAAERVPRWLDQLIMALFIILVGLIINRVLN